MILVFEERGRCDEMLVGEVFKYFYFCLKRGSLGELRGRAFLGCGGLLILREVRLWPKGY